MLHPLDQIVIDRHMSLDVGAVHECDLAARARIGRRDLFLLRCVEISSSSAASDMYANDSQHCSAALVSLDAANDTSVCYKLFEERPV